MRETQFIDRNKEKWEMYEAALNRDHQDPKLLSELYVHTTDDLSYSRTFYPNRSVRVYLNDLAQRTFLQIYRGRRGEAGRFLTFWTDELPRILYNNRRILLISLLLFFLAMGIGIISYLIDPQFAELIMGDYYMEMTRENIRSGDPMAVYKQRGQFDMFLSITFHNIYVALRTFIMGAFFAVGTVVILVSNGIMLGVFQYFFVEQELFLESFLTIWIHGALEISSIVIAGAAGMVMGSGLLFPGTYTRLQAFGRSARDGLKIMLGTVPLFIIAGFLEGYLTRHTEIAPVLRLFFILACFGFVLWYFWLYPKEVAQRPERARVQPQRMIKPVNESPIHFNRIKMLGEVLTDVFTVLRRQGKFLLPGLLGTALVYCLLVFNLTGDTAVERFTFNYAPLADGYNVYVLTSTFGFGRDQTFFCSVAVGFYLVMLYTFRMLQRERDPDWRPGSRQLLMLIIPTLLLTLLFSFSGGWVALTTFLLLPFVLTYSYLVFTGAGGLRTAFRYVYAHLNSSYGIFLLVLLLGVFTFFLLDTGVTTVVFQLLSWIISSDEIALSNYNVVIQAFLYWFYFSLVLSTWLLSLALNFHSVREKEEAVDLLGRIEGIGRQRRLRGLEIE